MLKTDVIKKVEKLCKEKGNHKLLYISKVGSHLFGANGPNSDEDYKFIYLPNKEFLLLGNKLDHITLNKGKTEKNTKDDVDLQGWSLQYFLHLLKKGESNGIDLLFSYSNRDARIDIHPAMVWMFKNPGFFYDPTNIKSYLGFANSQAKRYGVKGDRLRLVNNLINDPLLNSHLNDENINGRLESYMDYILENYGHEKFCYKEKNEDGHWFLVINESKHMGTIYLTEFMQRMVKEERVYGERAKKAMINDANDYKALYNTYRAYVQYLQLSKTGVIKYPFTGNVLELIKRIKYGKMSNENILTVIESVKETVDSLPENQIIESRYSPEIIKKFVLDMY